MPTWAKIIIISWLVVSYFLVGGISFYLGRSTAPKQESQTQQMFPPTGQPTGKPTVTAFPSPQGQPFQGGAQPTGFQQQGGPQQQFGQPQQR